MNTLTKVLLGALAVVVLAFVAIAVAVAFVFEPNDYRPFLVQTVEDATGRDFALEGDLGLKLFPCCGVSLGSATLGNPAGFPPEPFARFDSAAISVKIWPLLTRREVQIGTVTLDGLDVRMVELKDGRGNWAFESTGAPAEPAEPGESAVNSLTVEGVRISNGKVSFTSEASGASYSVADINVDAGAIGGNEPVPVVVSLNARDAGSGTTAAIELRTNFGMAGNLVQLGEPRLTVTASGNDIPTGEARVEASATEVRYDTEAGSGAARNLDALLSLTGTRIGVQGDAEFAGDTVTASGNFEIPEGNLRELLGGLPDVDYVPAGPNALKRLDGSGSWALTATGASLSNLQLHLDDSTITGSAGLTSFDTGALRADLKIDQLDVDAYAAREDGSASSAATGGKTEVPFEALADLPVDAKVQIGTLRASGIDLTALEVNLANDGRAASLNVASGLLGGQLKLSGSGNPGGSAPSLAGRLELNGVSPRAALTALGETIETADPDVLKRLSGSTRWKLGRRSLSLEQMSWQLDDTTLTGTLGIDDFDKAATRFDLALDHIDLDAYLAPEPEEETAASDGGDVDIPVEVIRGLDINGRLTAAALQVMDLALKNVEATVNATDGVLKLEPLRANLYGGSYVGTITIDATGAKSKLSLDQQISAVQIGELLNSLVGSDRIAGSLTFGLTGSGVGNTQNELLKQLTGNVAFNLSDGVYHGMDIAYEIENAQSLLKRTAAPERPNRRETPIRALSFKGSMADGVLGSDNLSAEIPFLKLAGKGGVNLIERTLDYHLDAQVLKSADNAPDSGLKGLAGSIIPLTIKGPMADPKVGVDLKGLVVETVKERATNALLKHLGVDTEAPATGAGGAESAASTPAPSPAADVTTDQTPTEAPQAPAAAETPSEAQAAEPEKPAEPPSTRDLLEQGLRGLLKKPDAKSDDK
jgi:AsmA protein